MAEGSDGLSSSEREMSTSIEKSLTSMATDGPSSSERERSSSSERSTSSEKSFASMETDGSDGPSSSDGSDGLSSSERERSTSSEKSLMTMETDGSDGPSSSETDGSDGPSSSERERSCSIENSITSPVIDVHLINQEIDFEPQFAPFSTNLSVSDPMQEWLKKIIVFEHEFTLHSTNLPASDPMQEWLMKVIDFESEIDPDLSCLQHVDAEAMTVHHPTLQDPGRPNILLYVMRKSGSLDANVIVESLKQTGNVRVVVTTEGPVGIGLSCEKLSDFDSLKRKQEDELAEWTTHLVVVADKDCITQDSLGLTGNPLPSMIDKYKGKVLIVAEITEDEWVLPSTVERVSNLKSKGYSVVNTIEGGFGILHAVAQWFD